MSQEGKTKKVKQLTDEESESLCLIEVNRALTKYACQLVPVLTLTPGKNTHKVNILHKNKVTLQ